MWQVEKGAGLSAMETVRAAMWGKECVSRMFVLLFIYLFILIRSSWILGKFERWLSLGIDSEVLILYFSAFIPCLGGKRFQHMKYVYSKYLLAKSKSQVISVWSTFLVKLSVISCSAVGWAEPAGPSYHRAALDHFFFLSFLFFYYYWL